METWQGNIVFVHNGGPASIFFDTNISLFDVLNMSLSYFAKR